MFICEIPVFQVVNTARPATLSLWLGEPTRFSISNIHSIYLQAAPEDFGVGKGNQIILRGVRMRNPSVAHHYGFDEDTLDYFPVDRRMKSFLLRLGMAQAQTLSHGEKKVSSGTQGKKETGWKSEWCECLGENIS